MGKFNKGYSNLFGFEDEMDDVEGKESTDEDEDEGSDSEDNYIKTFNRKWGWISFAIQVKEVKSITLDQVYEVNVVEFLNLLCYIKDKADFDRRQQKEYLDKIKNKH